MNKKPFIFKRIIAYFLDFLIVTIIASVITTPFSFNDKYQEKYNNVMEIMKDLQNKKYTESEYMELYDDALYEFTKSGIYLNITIVIITLIYYVIFNYYNKGQTIGKKLMNIKIVSTNNENVTINDYLIRCLVGNTALSSIVSVVLILTLSKENYMVYDRRISNVFSVIYIICFILVLYRNDGRGLHDFLAKTQVVNVEKENKNMVSEALIVNETKEDKKEKNIKIGNDSKKKNNSKKKSKSETKKLK